MRDAGKARTWEGWGMLGGHGSGENGRCEEDRGCWEDSWDLGRMGDMGSMGTWRVWEMRDVGKMDLGRMGDIGRTADMSSTGIWREQEIGDRGKTGIWGGLGMRVG